MVRPAMTKQRSEARIATVFPLRHGVIAASRAWAYDEVRSAPALRSKCSHCDATLFSAEESGRDRCGQGSRHGECKDMDESARQPQESVMKRKASAVWQGGLQDGKGSISTDSGVLKDTQYSFSTRFEDGVGTNPEE